MFYYLVYTAVSGSTVPINIAPLNNNTESESEPQKPEQQKPPRAVTALVCGLDESENLTDVIMLAMLDTGTKKVEVLQIPRDSYVGLNRYPTGKINSVYGSSGGHKKGIKNLKDEVSAMLKLDIDYYAFINLSTLRSVVDDVGGVYVDIPQTIYFSPGKTIKKGRQLLDGEKAEWFVRYRRGYENADIGRMNAQSIFIKAFAEKLYSMPAKELAVIAAKNITSVSTDVSITEAIGVIREVHGISPEDISFHALKGYGVNYKGYAVYSLDKAYAADLLNERFRPYSQKLEKEELDIIEIY